MNHSVNLAHREGRRDEDAVLGVGAVRLSMVPGGGRDPQAESRRSRSACTWRSTRSGAAIAGGRCSARRGVPSLVDSVGYFLSSGEAFLASKYDLGEVERELSAQVERALASGLKIAYVDAHMGTAGRRRSCARSPSASREVRARHLDILRRGLLHALGRAGRGEEVDIARAPREREARHGQPRRGAHRRANPGDGGRSST